MKIILNCLSHAWGGRETCFFDDITELKKNGHDVVGVVFQNSPISKSLKEKYPEIPVEEIKRLGFKYFNPKLLYQYYKIIKKHEPDLLHSHDIWTLYTLLLVMRLFPKIPIIATEHLYIEHKKTGFYRRFLYKRLDTMIAISHAMRKNVLEMYPLTENQVKTIYGGFAYKDADISTTEILTKEELHIPEKAFVIGMIGRIDPAKGQLELVQAFNELLKMHPQEEFYLCISGRPTLQTYESLEYEQSLRNYLYTNDLEARVKLLGFVNSVSEYLKILDLFVMPSYYEAFGLVAIQAMSHSLPLIVSDAGSARELVDINENGYVYPPGDIEGLSECLNKVYENSDRKIMGIKSQKKYEDTFAYSHHLTNITNLYKTKIQELSCNL